MRQTSCNKLCLILTILLLSLATFSSGCSRGTGEIEEEVKEKVESPEIGLPQVTGGMVVEESGATDKTGFVVAETVEGEKTSVIVTTMDKPPTEDDLLMYIITSATDDARSQGEEESFEITRALKETEPHDPTIILHISTNSAEKVYAGWFCNIEKKLLIASLSSSDSSFIHDIKCH